jgi:hypothetical protein
MNKRQKMAAAKKTRRATRLRRRREEAINFDPKRIRSLWEKEVVDSFVTHGWDKMEAKNHMTSIRSAPKHMQAIAYSMNPEGYVLNILATVKETDSQK